MSENKDVQASFRLSLLRLREERGWMQKELAERCGVSVAAISQWESGTRKPSFENLVQLANAFSVPVSALMGGGG